MADRLWCVDDHHDTPCPEPCAACRQDCSGVTVGEAVARRLYPEWTDAEREASLVGVRRDEVLMPDRP